MTSLYKIAEQIDFELGGGHDLQAIVAFVIDAYSSAVKSEWYENKADGCSEIDGAFLIIFGKTTPLIPAKDSFTGEYYIEMPSSVLRLPNEMGIARVSHMKSDQEFIRVNRLWDKNLKANKNWDRQVYLTEETRIYFPKMNDGSHCNIKLALVVAMDKIDVDVEMNIPRSVIDKITLSVASRFRPQPQVKAN